MRQISVGAPLPGASIEQRLKFLEDALSRIGVASYDTDGTPEKIAATVAFTPAGTVAATNVQDAIEEVSGDVTALTTATASDQMALHSQVFG